MSDGVPCTRKRPPRSATMWSQKTRGHVDVVKHDHRYDALADAERPYESEHLHPMRDIERRGRFIEEQARAVLRDPRR
jgi:hypothetical protein